MLEQCSKGISGVLSLRFFVSRLPTLHMDQATRQQSSFVYNVPAHDLLSIELKDPDRTYFPGDRISGIKRHAC